MARADADRAAAAERDRQTLCHLLAGRSQQDTALIVATSELRTDKESDFDGGEYEVSFAVPPQAYDASGERVAGQGSAIEPRSRRRT